MGLNVNLGFVMYQYCIMWFTVCSPMLVFFSYYIFLFLFCEMFLNSVDWRCAMFQNHRTCGRRITCTSRTVGQESWRDREWTSTSLVMCRLCRFTAWVRFCTRYLLCHAVISVSVIFISTSAVLREQIICTCVCLSVRAKSKSY